MSIRRTILTLAIAATTSVAAMAARTWEEVERYPAPIEQSMQQEDAAVQVHEGFVYVAIKQPVQVKLFTLLGQIIVQDTLKPGVYRGIYLLKIGSSTRRITL